MAEPAATSAAELVLASSSPFRRRLLQAAGLSFRVVPPDVDEAALKRSLGAAAPAGLARALACAKAQAVSARAPGALVIGADQVLALGERLYDKPGSLAEARAQLLELRGKTHQLHTAAALAQAGEVLWTFVDAASLTMRAFSPAFLEAYLAAAGDSLCAIVGAYEIEGRGIQLFERVAGDHFAIIGLPLLPLAAELRARGVLPA
jgi:septum formation protein